MPRSTTPFIRKTWELLSNEELKPIICWSSSGDSFVIEQPDLFQEKVLPTYFKHGNICSFVRQLNTYGFKKVTKKDCRDLEFKHKLFHKDQEDLLPHIVRRNAKSTTGSPNEDNSCSSTGASQEEDVLKQLINSNEQLLKSILELKEHQKKTDRELALVRSELTNTRMYMHSMNSSLHAMYQPNRCSPFSTRTASPQYGVTTKREQRVPMPRDQIFSSVEHLDSSPEQSTPQFDPQHVLPVNADYTFECDFLSTL